MDYYQTNANPADEAAALASRRSAGHARLESVCAPLEIEDYWIQGAGKQIARPLRSLARTVQV